MKILRAKADSAPRGTDITHMTPKLASEQGMPVDKRRGMCYNIGYRRSGLGVVSVNPEFGHERGSTSHAPLRFLLLPEENSEK